MTILRRYGAELDDTQQDAAGDLSKVPFHPADEGTDTFDRELDAQELSRVTEELHEIDAALERLYHDPDSSASMRTRARRFPSRASTSFPGRAPWWRQASAEQRALASLPFVRRRERRQAAVRALVYRSARRRVPAYRWSRPRPSRCRPRVEAP